MLVMFCADIVAALTAGALLQYFTPKKLFFFYFLIAGIAGACMIFYIDKENPNQLVLLLVGLSRLGISCSFISVYMTHPGYFPTLFAVTSMGIANIITRVVVIVAPLVAELDFPTPMIIFTMLQCAACISSCFINDEVRSATKKKAEGDAA